MAKWHTTVVAVAILLGASLVMAHNHTYTRYGFDIDNPGVSCADIYDKNPTSRGKSAYYILKTDHLFFAYCDMELDCGGSKGGWMRIADIKKGDTCPHGWRKYQHLPYCTGGSLSGCYSVNFTTNSTSYDRVCGKVVGYQKGIMDAFYPSAYMRKKLDQSISQLQSSNTEKIEGISLTSEGIGGYRPITASQSLDGVYVDGISITSGDPRKHVWTYAIGASDDHKPYNGKYNCPCAKYPGPDPPPFVGPHYYCESGNTGKGEHTELYTNDTLWDGKCCLPDNSCCRDVGMPWFFRQFPTNTTGNIEVRLCQDELLANEAVVVEEIQLYVQ